MNETREDHLTQMCEMLEKLVPMLQNNIGLLKEQVSTEKQLWHPSGKLIVTIFGIPVRCQYAKDTVIAVINKIGAEDVYNRCKDIGTDDRPLIKRFTDGES